MHVRSSVEVLRGRRVLRCATRVGVTAALVAGVVLTAQEASATTTGDSAPLVTVQASRPDAKTGKVRLRVVASDAFGSPLQVQAPARTGKGMVTGRTWTPGATEGSFTYTPDAKSRHAAARDNAPPAERTDRVTFTFTDGRGLTSAVSVTVRISPQNAMPVAHPTVGAVDVTGLVTGSVGATDADGDLLTYAVTTAPTMGTVVVAADGSFAYSPRPVQVRDRSGVNQGRTDTFTITVNDGYGGVVTIPISVPSSPAT